MSKNNSEAQSSPVMEHLQDLPSPVDHDDVFLAPRTNTATDGGTRQVYSLYVKWSRSLLTRREMKM